MITKSARGWTTTIEVCRLNELQKYKCLSRRVWSFICVALVRCMLDDIGLDSSLFRSTTPHQESLLAQGYNGTYSWLCCLCQLGLVWIERLQAGNTKDHKYVHDSNLNNCKATIQTIFTRSLASLWRQIWYRCIRACSAISISTINAIGTTCRNYTLIADTTAIGSSSTSTHICVLKKRGKNKKWNERVCFYLPKFKKYDHIEKPELPLKTVFNT